MHIIFKDEAKIKKYAKIQKKICDLTPIASDEDIEKIIKYNTDVKILEMISKYEVFDENIVNLNEGHENALFNASFNRNLYALQFLDTFFDSLLVKGVLASSSSAALSIIIS